MAAGGALAASRLLVSAQQARQVVPGGAALSPPTVLVNGRAIKSCNTLAVQHPGADITTIEGGASADGTLHPMQAAFKECHGLQCGFCTPGMVMSALDLCEHHPDATESQIREQLDGNICRCTGYQNIVKAVQQGAAAMKATA